MCTSIGFSYNEGIVFGRTLEIGIELDNKILYVPGNTENFIDAKNIQLPSKYATIGSGFLNIESFGDGINEMGLMGSSNLFPQFASFSRHPILGKINMTTANAFDFLLTTCKDVEEVKEKAKKIVLLERGDREEDVSGSNHFFFMDTRGERVVLEPKEGLLVQFDNPYGVLTNAPEFHWHEINLSNYINLKADNIDGEKVNGKEILKLGQGTGMLGIPGDFTPPSRFIRASYFVSNTPKDLDRNPAIIQGFRILSQFDIPEGSVVDLKEGHKDQTLYTCIMDTKERVYFIKCHENLSLQAFKLDDYKDEKEIRFIELIKEMNL